MNRSPAFQFYAGDFLSDGRQIVMELAEVGAYIRLICACWKEGHIPDDVRKLAKLAGCTVEEMRAVWPAVGPCFEPDPAFKGFLVHPRLEKERKKQVAFKEAKSKAGKEGAARRWADKVDGRAITLPMAKNSSSASAVTSVGFSASAVSSSAHSGEEEASALASVDKLVAYVGEASRPAVEACARLRGLSPSWPTMLLGSFGPGEKLDPAINRIPESERAQVLALALQRYASDAKEWSSRFFRSFVTKAWADRTKGEAEDKALASTVTKHAGLRPVIEPRKPRPPSPDSEKPKAGNLGIDLSAWVADGPNGGHPA